MKRKDIFLILLSMVFIACSKTDEDNPVLTYDYFPLEAGNYIEYKVIEYTYDDFNNTVDTNEYFLKEKVDSVANVVEGVSIFQLKRYTMAIDDSTETWILKDVWTTERSSQHAIRTEENVKFVNLSFPLQRNKSWDGNARNDSSAQSYVVLDFELRNEIGSTSFAQTTRVNKRNDVNLVKENFAEDIFARGVGLVYRIKRDLILNPADTSIVSGYDHEWTYQSHGKE